ncbi:hypothetical protein PG994_009060 [Apiospora phragmitis]|uniref:Uncharacterized protein n=1 Tax=Apiospora phragmitis TaxID=2905665 RepID=A0ABR1UIS0_9PEZI
MSSSTPAVKVSSGARPHDDSSRMLSDGSGASRATSKPDGAGSANNEPPNSQDAPSNAQQGSSMVRCLAYSCWMLSLARGYSTLTHTRHIAPTKLQAMSDDELHEMTLD